MSQSNIATVSLILSAQRSNLINLISRHLPDTICEKIPFEACAPDNCEWVAGEPQCKNVTQDVTVDSPEEVCDLQPQKMCKQVSRVTTGVTDTIRLSRLKSNQSNENEKKLPNILTFNL